MYSRRRRSRVIRWRSFLTLAELTDAEMQALAREMNLSETTFIFPRDGATEAREGKKVRIFTVEAGIAICRASDARHSAVFVCVGIQRSPPKSLST